MASKLGSSHPKGDLQRRNRGTSESTNDLPLESLRVAFTHIVNSLCLTPCQPGPHASPHHLRSRPLLGADVAHHRGRCPGAPGTGTNRGNAKNQQLQQNFALPRPRVHGDGMDWGGPAARYATPRGMPP